MSEDDFSINTNCIVAAVINKRLQKEGINWQTSPTQNSPDNIVINTVIRVCEEFERRYEKDFANFSDTLNELELNYESYTAVLEHSIEGGMNWGRVIAVFTFAGVSAVQCIQMGHPETVDFLREWTCSFLHNKVEQWVYQNNGWKGLVEFYGGNTQEVEKSKTWNPLMAVGALGAVALGALIVNRA